MGGLKDRRLETQVRSNGRPLRLAFVSHNLSSNPLGRVYSLWLVARALGWEGRVVGPWRGAVWRPLRTCQFVERCEGWPDDQWPGTCPDALEWADVILAVKPLPTSFGVARLWAQELSKPLVLDVDDADLEFRLLRRPHRINLWRSAVGAKRVPVMTSNPSLQRRWGGELVPHVRTSGVPGRAHTTSKPVIAFVGTPRVHKGIDILRLAVEQLVTAGHACSLLVTADEPADARPWEMWTGPTSMSEGRRIVSESDVVGVVSENHAFARSQFPVKLVDGMLAARAVLTTDLPVHRWALGDAGVFVPPGRVDPIRRALLKLREPELRSRLGQAARRRALERFTPEAAAGAFERVVRSAVDGRA